MRGRRIKCSRKIHNYLSVILGEDASRRPSHITSTFLIVWTLGSPQSYLTKGHHLTPWPHGMLSFWVRKGKIGASIKELRRNLRNVNTSRLPQVQNLSLRSQPVWPTRTDKIQRIALNQDFKVIIIGTRLRKEMERRKWNENREKAFETLSLS